MEQEFTNTVLISKDARLKRKLILEEKRAARRKHHTVIGRQRLNRSTGLPYVNSLSCQIQCIFITSFMGYTGTINLDGTTAKEQSFQSPLADITNTHPNSNDLQNRRRKSMTKVSRIQNNLLNEFTAASSSTTTQRNQETDGHRTALERPNILLENTEVTDSDESTGNAGNNNDYIAQNKTWHMLYMFSYYC